MSIKRNTVSPMSVGRVGFPTMTRFSPAIYFSPDDGGVGSGGGGGENGENGPAPQPSVTHEDLQAFKNSLFADMRKMTEGVVSSALSKHSKSAPSAPAKAEAKPQAPDANQRVDVLEYKLAVKDALVNSGLDSDARQMLEELALATRPENLSEFVQSKAKLFANAPAPENTQLEPEPSVRKPPVSDAGTPRATSAGETSDDVLQWSTEDYNRQFAMKAKNPANPYDVRNREFYREVRLRAEAAMSKTRVALGPKRG